MKTYVGSGAVLVLALFVMIFQPFGNALSLQSQLMLGGILITFGIWIFKPLTPSPGAMFSDARLQLGFLRAWYFRVLHRALSGP